MNHLPRILRYTVTMTLLFLVVIHAHWSVAVFLFSLFVTTELQTSLINSHYKILTGFIPPEFIKRTLRRNQ